MASLDKPNQGDVTKAAVVALISLKNLRQSLDNAITSMEEFVTARMRASDTGEYEVGDVPLVYKEPDEPQ
jgi:hypothetical protein